MSLNRRHFLQFSGAAGFGLLTGCATKTFSDLSKAHVIVVGGGFGGATAAKYLKKFSPNLKVTLIEPKKHYMTGPASNWVLAGMRDIKSIQFDYKALEFKHGIRVIHEWVASVEPDQRKVKLSSGDVLSYDRLIVSPGIDFRFDTIEGLDKAAQKKMPNAYKEDKVSFVRFKNQIDSMKDGGTMIIAPPPNPFRCPPGPYERVSVLANYFKQNKPKSKILVLDAKPKFSKQSLFEEGWKRFYGYGSENSMIEWLPEGEGRVTAVDAGNMTVTAGALDEKHHGDVINIIPAQKAAKLAENVGLTDKSGWCPVSHLTWESKIHSNIHVIGDAAIGGKLPKSGYAANSEAKVCAAAIVELLQGNEPLDPTWINTCYSLVHPLHGISVAMVYSLAKNGEVIKVKGAGGVSEKAAGKRMRFLEAGFAKSWYTNITDDTFS